MCWHAQELTKYETALFHHPEVREAVVRAAQHRTTAAELGIMPSDSLKDLDSLPARIAFLNGLAETVSIVSIHMMRMPSSALCSYQH